MSLHPLRPDVSWTQLPCPRRTREKCHAIMVSVNKWFVNVPACTRPFPSLCCMQQAWESDWKTFKRTLSHNHPLPGWLFWIYTCGWKRGGGGGGDLFFPPSSPLGTLHYSKDTYWALHFLVHLWHQARLANHSKKERKKDKKTQKNKRKPGDSL